VTIQQQVVETFFARPSRDPAMVMQITEIAWKYSRKGSAARVVRLAIYLTAGTRYEKTCKSAQLMTLAGGEFR
jgi:hypothetical protein